MHISFHQFSHNVDIFEASRCWRFENINKVYDVLLVKKFEELDFSNNALSIDQIFKGLWHFLDSNFFTSLMVICTTDNSVSSVPNLLYVLILGIDIERGAYKGIK